MLEPQIRLGQIVNLDEILKGISKVDDDKFLIDYLDDLDCYENAYPNAVSSEELSRLKNALKARLNEISSLEKIITVEEFLKLYQRLSGGEELSETESKQIDAFINKALSLMEKSLDYNKITKTQEALDEYIIYLENHGTENAVTKKYHDIINSRKPITNGKKPLRIKKIDTDGHIKTLVIIESTILLGILLGVLAFII